MVLGEPAVAPGVGRFITDEPSFFRAYAFEEGVAIISHPVYKRPDVQIFVIIIVHDHVLCPVCKICVVKNHIAVVIHAAGQVKEIAGIFQTGGGVIAAIAVGIKVMPSKCDVSLKDLDTGASLPRWSFLARTHCRLQSAFKKTERQSIAGIPDPPRKVRYFQKSIFGERRYSREHAQFQWQILFCLV